MGRPQKRTWMASPLATAVEIVGGMSWAVAISGLTKEGLTVALRRGHIVDGRAAVKLARATLEKGRPISVDALVGLRDELLPSGTDGPGMTTKGAAARSPAPRKVSRLFARPGTELAA